MNSGITFLNNKIMSEIIVVLFLMIGAGCMVLSYINDSERIAFVAFSFFFTALIIFATKEDTKTDYKIELLNQKQVEVTTKDGGTHIISADSIQQFINKTQK